jgi:hypothetical protein
MFQNSIAMCLRHGENKIGIGRNSRREPSRGEVRCVTTQLLEDKRGIGMNRMREYRAGPSAGCFEVRNLKTRPVRRGKSLRRR